MWNNFPESLRQSVIDLKLEIMALSQMLYTFSISKKKKMFLLKTLVHVKQTQLTG